MQFFNSSTTHNDHSDVVEYVIESREYRSTAHAIEINIGEILIAVNREKPFHRLVVD